MINEKLLKSNACKLGRDTNWLQIIEECGELSVAICKLKRTLGEGQKTEVTKDEAWSNVIKEVADVYICLEQFILLNGCRDAVESWGNHQLERTAKRYEGESKPLKGQVELEDYLREHNGEN